MAFWCFGWLAGQVCVILLLVLFIFLYFFCIEKFIKLHKSNNMIKLLHIRGYDCELGWLGVFVLIILLFSLLFYFIFYTILLLFYATFPKTSQKRNLLKSKKLHKSTKLFFKVSFFVIFGAGLFYVILFIFIYMNFIFTFFIP